MAQKCLGIHIGEQRILCVEVAGSSNSLAVERIGSIPLPAGAVVEGFIESPNIIASLLEPVLEKMDISTHIASVNIPMSLCQIKSFPFEPGYDLISENQLTWEIGKHIGQPIDQFTVDKFSSGQELVVVASRKSQVEIRERVLLLAGLTPHSIYPDPIAIFNTLAVARGPKPQAKTIVLDAQTPHSTITFFVQGDFHFGGFFFTHPGLFESGDETKRDEWVEDALSAIMLAIDSYRFVNPAFVADELLFTGCNVPESVQSKVAQELGINLAKPSEVFQRRIKIKPKRSDFKPGELFVPIGLATSIFDGGKSDKVGKG